MILKDLSDKEIKTINGGTGYEFPFTSFVVFGILGALQNLKDLTINVYNGVLSWFIL